MLWNMGSSAGGVSGIELLVAAMSARSGSSTWMRFSFFGGVLLLVMDDRREVGRFDRCEDRRESDFLVR